MKWLFGNIEDITPEQYNNIFETLSNSRKARVNRFKKEDDRRRSLMATHLAHKLLEESGYTNVTLENAPNGKPYLTGCDLCVSISHSGNGVVCAISDREIGIDIEYIKPVKDGLIEYVCTKQELEYIYSDFKDIEKDITDVSVMQKFYAVWTAKEAYFKKCGSNITDIRSINTFSFNKQSFYIDDFIITIVE